MSVLDKLQGNKQVEIPMEGEGFPSFGFIGPIKSRMLWNFYSTFDLSAPEYRDDIPPYFHREQTGNGYQYFYLEREPGDLAAQVDPDAYRPRRVWYFQMPVREVINVDTSNFQSSHIARSCQVTTLQSKYRHELHMITLPAIVAAIAKDNGYDVPEYDLSELLVRNAVITDTMTQELIGTPPGYQDYEESTLWKRRAELWAALGEPDPKKYLVGATKKTKDDGEIPHEQATQAEKLMACLRIFHIEWPEAPLWGRLQMVADPRAGALTSKGNRLTIPAVTEFFDGPEAAQAAVDEELKDFVREKTEAQPQVAEESGDKPGLPEAWEGQEEAFRVEIVMPLMDKPKALAKRGFDEGETGATFEETWAWVEWEKANP